MVQAICIKNCEGINKGEIVKAWQVWGRVHFYKGFRVGINLTKQKFEEHFTGFNSYYIVEKLPQKRRFRKPKQVYLRVDFRGISKTLLVELYNHVFSYIELIKQVNKELILTFNFSIVSTLEKLEFLYSSLPEQKFHEAIKEAEKVFIGIYNTALSLEAQALPKETDYNRLLAEFKQDTSIISSFFDELNR